CNVGRVMPDPAALESEVNGLVDQQRRDLCGLSIEEEGRRRVDAPPAICREVVSGPNYDVARVAQDAAVILGVHLRQKPEGIFQGREGAVSRSANVGEDYLPASHTSSGEQDERQRRDGA